MIPKMALRRIDIAPAGRGTEFPHGLQDVRIKPRPLIRLTFSDADF
jgi:hypothetical protein